MYKGCDCMKKNINISLLLSVLVLMILIIWSSFEAFQYAETFEENREARVELIRLCEQNNEEVDPEICNIVYERGVDIIKPDTISLFFYLLMDTSLYNIQILAPLFIILISAYHFFREYSTGFYKNKLTRMTYLQYLKEVLKKAYQCIWIYPIWILILFFISYLISGHFDYQNSIINPIDEFYIQHFLTFIFVFLFNIVLNSIFYVHLALLPIRKNPNYIVSIFSSYILFLIWDIVSEILIGTILFELVLGISQTSNLFSLFNYWVYDGISNLGIYIGINVLHVIISFLIFYVVYSNKEKVVISSES